MMNIGDQVKAQAIQNTVKEKERQKKSYDAKHQPLRFKARKGGKLEGARSGPHSISRVLAKGLYKLQTKTVLCWKHHLTAQGWRSSIIRYSDTQTRELLQTCLRNLVHKEDKNTKSPWKRLKYHPKQRSPRRQLYQWITKHFKEAIYEHWSLARYTTVPNIFIYCFWRICPNSPH